MTAEKVRDVSDRESIDPDYINTTATISRAEDDVFLRQIMVDVSYEDEDGSIPIGHVFAWIGWDVAEEDIHDAADAISQDAEVLGAIAAEIVKASNDLWIDTVLMIDRIVIAPNFRGNRFTGAMGGGGPRVAP